MDPNLSVIGLIATLIGILAGVVQIVEYVSKRRKGKDNPIPKHRTPEIKRIYQNLPSRAFLKVEKKKKRRLLKPLTQILNLSGLRRLGEWEKALLHWMLLTIA